MPHFLAAYCALLDRYDTMIRNEPWWDGRREKLVAEMDRVWVRLNETARNQAIAHSQWLYDRALEVAS